VPPGWILQHGYFLEPEQIRRYAALGFEVTPSIGFRWGKQEMIRERFGEALVARFIPLRELLDSGCPSAAAATGGPRTSSSK
jgi:predicted amidohydrolase YtcJ